MAIDDRNVEGMAALEEKRGSGGLYVSVACGGANDLDKRRRAKEQEEERKGLPPPFG